MHMIEYGRTLASGLAGVVMLLATVATLMAQDTPTEAIAGCIKNSYDKNYQCQTDGKWWNDLACAIKLEADIILCTFPHVPQ